MIVLLAQSPHGLPVATIPAEDGEIHDFAIVVDDQATGSRVGPGEFDLLGLYISEADFDDGLSVFRTLLFVVQLGSATEIGGNPQAVMIPYDFTSERARKSFQILFRV